tara:strand:- start:711 stop:1019 length:309 start_codon:yes stop_codon:yes gene_type:complete
MIDEKNKELMEQSLLKYRSIVAGQGEESLGSFCTRRINILLDEVSKLASVRREWWFEMNQNQNVSQPKLAEDAGVVSHTVYTEIRKYKESKQCQSQKESQTI